MGVRSDILAAIVARIEEVDSVAAAGGTVHNRERYTQQAQPFADAFKGSLGSIRGWWVTFEGSRDVYYDAQGSALAQPTRLYAFRVYHATGLDDEESTYTDHQDRIESLADDLLARRDLGVSSVIDYSVETEMSATEAVILGDFLCWRGYVDVIIDTRRSLSYA